MPARVYNSELDILRSINDPGEGTTPLKSAAYCEVATNILLALLNACQGHFCGNVRRNLVNNASI